MYLLITLLAENSNMLKNQKMWLQTEKTRKNQFTSGIQRAAAERRRCRGLSFPAVGLHDELVALHQPLADELLKHLRRTHHGAFVLPPGEGGGSNPGTRQHVAARRCNRSARAFKVSGWTGQTRVFVSYLSRSLWGSRS